MAARCTTSTCRKGKELLNETLFRSLPHARAVLEAWLGGSKKSSYGAREQGFSALEFYTQIKTSYLSG